MTEYQWQSPRLSGKERKHQTTSTSVKWPPVSHDHGVMCLNQFGLDLDQPKMGLPYLWKKILQKYFCHCMQQLSRDRKKGSSV